MKSVRLTVLVITALSLVALPASADHHANGTWELEVDLGGQGGTATIELTESEPGKLAGTYSGALGQESVAGTVDGAAVAFSFSSGQAGTVTYEGTIDGDSMSGTCAYGDLGSGTFAGSRKAE